MEAVVNRADSQAGLIWANWLLSARNYSVKWGRRMHGRQTGWGEFNWFRWRVSISSVVRN